MNEVIKLVLNERTVAIDCSQRHDCVLNFHVRSAITSTCVVAATKTTTNAEKLLTDTAELTRTLSTVQPTCSVGCSASFTQRMQGGDVMRTESANRQRRQRQRFNESDQPAHA